MSPWATFTYTVCRLHERNGDGRKEFNKKNKSIVLRFFPRRTEILNLEINKGLMESGLNGQENFKRNPLKRLLNVTVSCLNDKLFYLTNCKTKI